jgi:two-component system, OmpR family, sensor histidine kinase KdpD
MLLYLTAVVGIAFGGGLRPAVPAAIASVLLINWFFTPPLHTWKIADPEDLVALLVFLVVAASVSVLVDRDSRHRAEVGRRRAEAEALTRLAAHLAEADDPLPELVERLRSTFDLRSVAVLQETSDGWRQETATGEDPATDPLHADQTVELADGSVLALVGDPLPAESLQLLGAFVAQLSVALRGRVLAREASEAAELTAIDAFRTAILAAVSHDLRTPLASIKASVSSLRDDDVAWSPDATAEFLETIEDETDRLSDLVANLLDMSRLQAGALTLVNDVVGFDEIVPKALASLADRGRGVDVEVPETLPRMDVDPGLLERAVANLVANARVWSPAPGSVHLRGSAAGGRVELRVVDRGPGVSPAERERMFEPFQRLGDRSTSDGLGLGLAVAQGFVQAMGGELSVEDTPGGGLTMVIGFTAVAS